MKLTSLDTALYRIELPVPLSDSTHGTMTHFELVTVRLGDKDGAEGVDSTSTTEDGGSAPQALIDQGLRPVLLGADADQIEALWTRMWWKLHYGGGGGAGWPPGLSWDIDPHYPQAPKLWGALW